MFGYLRKVEGGIKEYSRKMRKNTGEGGHERFRFTILVVVRGEKSWFTRHYTLCA